jgi:hypothetical protein
MDKLSLLATFINIALQGFFNFTRLTKREECRTRELMTYFPGQQGVRSTRQLHTWELQSESNPVFVLPFLIGGLFTQTR